MVDLLNTELGVLTKNAKMLNEATAWINSFDFEVKNEIIYFIQKDQLFDKGVDANNEVIGYYSVITETQYNSNKKAGEHYTMLDTGDFFKSMFVRVLNDSFEVEAKGKKQGVDILVKYGNDIIGLTQESKEKLVGILTKKYIDYVRQILQIG
jgi:hypothetical protein